MSEKILIIGQALPQKLREYPFQGSLLYKWFESINISKEMVLQKCTFTAILEKFPGKINGSDRVPNQSEILENIPRLEKLILDNHIEVIIPVGKLAIRTILNNEKIDLRDAIGKKFVTQPFNLNQEITVLPLPHPSGLSTWVYKEENKLLLNKALLEIIFQIHDQDGRGWGDWKMYNQKIMHETNLNTVETAKAFYQDEPFDIRTYDDMALILKALGFDSSYSLELGTNNFQKLNDLTKHGFTVTKNETLVAKNLGQPAQKNLDAKTQYYSQPKQI